MNGIDTNPLVRLIVNDDEDQVRRIHSLIKRTGSLSVNDVVAAETAWVLRTRYRATPKDIAHAFTRILSGSDIVALDEAILRLASSESAQQGFGIADGLIGARNRRAGCETTWTFDRRAARSDLFTMVP